MPIDFGIKRAEIMVPRLSYNGLLDKYKFFEMKVTCDDDDSERTVIVRENPKYPGKLYVCFIVNIHGGGYDPEKFGVTEEGFCEETGWKKIEDWEVFESKYAVNLFARTESYFVIPAIKKLLSGEDCDVVLHWIELGDFLASKYYLDDYDGCERILDEEPNSY